MNESEPLLHQLGTFDPTEATRLVAILEQHGVVFEIETDQSALSGSNDFSGLQFGVNPEGEKIMIFVPEAQLAQAQELMGRLA